MSEQGVERLVVVVQAIGRGLAWFGRHVLWNLVRFSMWAIIVVGVGTLLVVLSCISGRSRLTNLRVPMPGAGAS